MPLCPTLPSLGVTGYFLCNLGILFALAASRAVSISHSAPRGLNLRLVLTLRLSTSIWTSRSRLPFLWLSLPLCLTLCLCHSICLQRSAPLCASPGSLCASVTLIPCDSAALCHLVYHPLRTSLPPLSLYVTLHLLAFHPVPHITARRSASFCASLNDTTPFCLTLRFSASLFTSLSLIVPSLQLHLSATLCSPCASLRSSVSVAVSVSLALCLTLRLSASQYRWC